MEVFWRRLDNPVAIAHLGLRDKQWLADLKKDEYCNSDLLTRDSSGQLASVTGLLRECLDIIRDKAASEDREGFDFVKQCALVPLSMCHLEKAMQADGQKSEADVERLRQIYEDDSAAKGPKSFDDTVLEKLLAGEEPSLEAARTEFLNFHQTKSREKSVEFWSIHWNRLLEFWREASRLESEAEVDSERAACYQKVQRDLLGFTCNNCNRHWDYGNGLHACKYCYNVGPLRYLLGRAAIRRNTQSSCMQQYTRLVRVTAVGRRSNLILPGIPLLLLLNIQTLGAKRRRARQYQLDVFGIHNPKLAKPRLRGLAPARAYQLEVRDLVIIDRTGERFP
ncbi:conserved hypothetical protein [Talaromyces stipitatus ATCC 10500]|uniref:Uncharacterized protein n=1 Tax=Talaromyces stipitatus (strain ATCC 10500 / CBS 375.48 / QM 6759 / NRRL 1006) TaxID=441959 RepID=B8LTC8_TALSN|nr:uncharacterized protein TSTA_064720 [Talaromyces stipitatus ATCC 10500]EED23006.1 conserved hypothetical protein [Talaromyces stipitatus ATCC 10500]